MAQLSRPKLQLSSYNACRVLKDSGFQTTAHWSQLGSELGVSVDDRRRLLEQSQHIQNYDTALEKCLDIWIRNSIVMPTWDVLIQGVERYERVTAENMRSFLKTGKRKSSTHLMSSEEIPPKRLPFFTQMGRKKTPLDEVQNDDIVLGNPVSHEQFESITKLDLQITDKQMVAIFSSMESTEKLDDEIETEEFTLEMDISVSRLPSSNARFQFLQYVASEKQRKQENYSFSQRLKEETEQKQVMKSELNSVRDENEIHRKISLAKAKEVATQTLQLQKSQQEKMKIQSDLKEAEEREEKYITEVDELQKMLELHKLQKCTETEIPTKETEDCTCVCFKEIGERSTCCDEWKKSGFTIHIARNKLEELNSCEVVVTPVSGNFKIPKETELVSAVYAVSCKLPLPIMQRVSLHVEHCVKLENEEHAEYLSFALARFDHHPHTFVPLTGGEFPIKEHYGAIEFIVQNSLIAILKSNITSDSPQIQSSSPRCYYIGQTYYETKAKNRWEWKFAAMKNLQAFSKYTCPDATRGPQVVFDFRSVCSRSCIELHIDEEKRKALSRWGVSLKVYPCKIFKENVDKYPYYIDNDRMEHVFCCLDVRAEVGAPCDLNFPVELKGIESDIERLYINCFKDTVKESTSANIYEDVESKFHAVCTCTLVFNDIYHVFEYCKEFSGHWKMMAASLKIKYSAIQIIQTDAKDCKQAMFDVLSEWLTRMDHDQPHPTWKFLCEAIANMIGVTPAEAIAARKSECSKCCN